MILSIDPGARSIAWAVFREGRLWHCGLLREDAHAKLTSKAEALFGTCVESDEVVIEWPQVYQQRRWKGDPNDLIDVAAIAGAVRHACRAAFVRTVRPHDWKGSAPKAVISDRIRQRLDERELEVLYRVDVPASLRHNVIDAVGLGLWHLRRL